jgi:hypothetical protein
LADCVTLAMFPTPYGNCRSVCNLPLSAAAQCGTARKHAARRSVSVARSFLAHTVKLFAAGGAPPRPHVVSRLVGQERLAGAWAPACRHSRRKPPRFRSSHPHRRTRERPAPVDSSHIASRVPWCCGSLCRGPAISLSAPAPYRYLHLLSLAA